MLRSASLAPDVIYANATVLTMDEAHPRAEALATQGERIVAIGSSAEVRALAGPGTRVLDMAERVILPGFIEPHNHFGIYALWKEQRLNLNAPPLGPVARLADLVDLLRARASRTPRGQWVLGYGYDDTLVAEGRHPTRHDLDRASAEHPIWIAHVSGHFGVANSMALARAGVTDRTPLPAGGVIRREPGTQAPDGVLEELPAQELVAAHVPPPTLEQRVEAMAKAVEDYLRQGVTSSTDAAVAMPGMGSRDEIVAYQVAATRGLLPFRVSMMIAPEVLLGPNGDQAAFLTGFGNSRLKIGAIKLIADGSIQGYTGWLAEPYHVPFRGDPSYRGYPTIPPERLDALVSRAHRAGFQLAIHGNGDAAIDAILDAYARAQQEWPRADARHRIEHCQTIREDQLDRAAGLGVTPSFFVSHTYYWGDRHRVIFLGPRRAERISPLRSARARGIRFSLHSDCPVTPVSPLFCVSAAVNRVTSGGQVLGPEQGVTPAEALRAVTIDAAWQCFEEALQGSIEVGKLADLTVLDQDPLAVPPEKIRDIRVTEVVVGGRRVYGSVD